ncbi:hypothetical protein MRX96_015639 [Rhipicephalus microplus]
MCLSLISDGLTSIYRVAFLKKVRKETKDPACREGMGGGIVCDGSRAGGNHRRDGRRRNGSLGRLRPKWSLEGEVWLRLMGASLDSLTSSCVSFRFLYRLLLR